MNLKPQILKPSCICTLLWAILNYTSLLKTFERPSPKSWKTIPKTQFHFIKYIMGGGEGREKRATSNRIASKWNDTFIPTFRGISISWNVSKWTSLPGLRRKQDEAALGRLSYITDTWVGDPDVLLASEMLSPTYRWLCCAAAHMLQPEIQKSPWLCIHYFHRQDKTVRTQCVRRKDVLEKSLQSLPNYCSRNR